MASGPGAHRDDLELRVAGRMLEQPDAVAEEERRDVDENLVDQPLRQRLLAWRGAAELHVLVPGHRLRLMNRAGDAVGDEGEIGRTLRHRFRRRRLVGQHEHRHAVHRVAPAPAVGDVVGAPAEDEGPRVGEHLVDDLAVHARLRVKDVEIARLLRGRSCTSRRCACHCPGRAGISGRHSDRQRSRRATWSCR